MKAAPTPLFNYRKRQCQAIFSDPQQLSANTAASDCHQVLLHDQDAGVGRNLSFQNSVINKENMATQFNRASTGFHHSGNVTMATDTARKPLCGSARQNNPGLMNVKGQFTVNGATTPTQQWSNSKFSSQRPLGTQSMTFNQAGNQQLNTSNSGRTVTATSTGIRPQSSNITTTSSSSMMRSISSTKAPTAGQAHSFMAGFNNTAKVHQDGRSTPLGNNPVSKYATDNTLRPSTCHGTAPYTRKDGGSSHQFSTDSTDKSRNNFSGIQWSSAKATQNKSDFSFGEDNNGDFLYGHEFPGKTIRDGNQKSGVKQSNQLLDSPAKPDMSMRIFTCTISMMKSWAARRDHQGLVMFEIFGVIDSAMVRDHTGTGREFLLRDDTSTVTCVFYEIDRDIPRLIRGQVCRVMASALDKEKRLHIVSVRAALVEERLVCQAATQLSQIEMDRLVM